MENYKILKMIGRGSFGRVLLVERIQQGVQIEIPQSMPLNERVKCITEIESLCTLQECPFIVRLYESFIWRHKKTAYICMVMEHCEGGDLYQRIQQQRRCGKGFNEQQIKEWIIMIAAALQQIHAMRMIHRDLKSANVFLTREGCVKVGDFGIARRLKAHEELAKTAIGTPYYSAPEICSDSVYSQKADIWQLGCILYELLALKHPFDAQNVRALATKIVHTAYSPVSELYSKEIRELLTVLLNKDAAQRPTALQVLHMPVLTHHLDAQLAIMLQRQMPRLEKSQQNQIPQNINEMTQSVSRHESLNNFLQNNNLCSSSVAVRSFEHSHAHSHAHNTSVLENAFVKSEKEDSVSNADDNKSLQFINELNKQIQTPLHAMVPERLESGPSAYALDRNSIALIQFSTPNSFQ